MKKKKKKWLFFWKFREERLSLFYKDELVCPLLSFKKHICFYIHLLQLIAYFLRSFNSSDVLREAMAVSTKWPDFLNFQNNSHHRWKIFVLQIQIITLQILKTIFWKYFCLVKLLGWLRRKALAPKTTLADRWASSVSLKLAAPRGSAFIAPFKVFMC